MVSYKVVQQKVILERTVPSNVHKTVRRVTVTSQRAPVWVVSLDTEEIGVQKVSGYIIII